MGRKAMMVRSDGDSWDIATGVGLTAVTVAASRAAETASASPLVVDPYAALLIGTDELKGVMTELAAAQLDSASAGPGTQALIDYHAGRTRFFDHYFEEAAAAGIRQHVILASGLDARAFRLAWPPACEVFEIDQPLVLEYKANTLRHNGVEALVEWTPVGVDLRSEWQVALESAGFDALAPTAWLAEGLLPFLSGEAQEVLFDRIEALSAPGSRVAVEAFNVVGGSLLEMIGREVTRGGATSDDANSTLQNLWYGDDGRSDPVQWWRDSGWQVTHQHATDYLARCGRPISNEAESFARLVTFVTGVKN